MGPGRRGEALALAVLLVASLALRLQGIGFGLPNLECRPDESRILTLALGFWDGDLDPHFFRYPTLYPYLASATFGVDLAAGALAPGDALDAFAARRAQQPERFLLLARVLTALLGTASVALLWVAARALGVLEAWGASALLAVSHLHVRDSHFATTDVPMTAFIVAALVPLAAIARGAGPGAYAAAGALAGFAASTKYAGALLALPVALAHLLAPGQPLAARLLDRRLLPFGTALGAAFLAGSPWALADPAFFWREVRFEAEHLEAGHLVDVGSGFARHLSFSLRYGVGAPALLAAGVGLVVLAWRAPRTAAVWFAFPLAYYALIGRGRTAFVRYAIPLVPFACLAAALAIAALARWLSPRMRLAIAPVGAVLFGAVALPPLVTSIGHGSLLTRKDTRLLAREWLDAHVASGAPIYQSGQSWGKVQLPPSWELLALQYPARNDLRKRLQKARLNRGGPGFDEWTFKSGRFHVNEAPVDGAPEWIVLQEHPLRRFTEVPDEVRALVASAYEPVARYEGTSAAVPGDAFDVQDAFFVPYAPVAGVVRPGPNLSVYRRRSAERP